MEHATATAVLQALRKNSDMGAFKAQKFELPLIKDLASYIGARPVFDVFSRKDGFKTGRDDGLLITDHTNQAASTLWEEQLTLMYTEGEALALFQHTDEFNGKGFEMFQALEDNYQSSNQSMASPLS